MAPARAHLWRYAVFEGAGRDPWTRVATPDDVRDVALPVLRHRLSLRAEAELDGCTPDAVITDILKSAEVQDNQNAGRTSHRLETGRSCRQVRKKLKSH